MAKRERSEPSGFWEQAQMMNLVADLLFLAAILALAYAAVLGALRLPFFPLREVVLEAPLRQVTGAQLEYAARSSVSGNFFTVDLERVRAAFEKLPWVRRVTVRRVWPEGVALAIEEHTAVAHWKPGGGEARLVNAQGEVFAAASNAALPALVGPEGSAAEMLQRFDEFGRALAPLGRRPERLMLSARLAWQIRLDDGLTIDLGRDQPRSPAAERLAGFVAAYPQALAKAGAPAESVDLRYPNGFALRLAGGRSPTKSRK